MSNLKKLEGLFLSLSNKIGSEDSPSAEELKVFKVFDRAFDDPEFECEDKLPKQEVWHKSWRPTILRAVVAAAILLAGVAVYFAGTVGIHKQLLNIANAANDRGDLLSLLTSVRNLSSLNRSLDSPLEELAQRLEEEPLNSIASSLLKGDDYAALEAAAVEIASTRKLRETPAKELSRKASETASLLSRFLLRKTDLQYAHKKQRVYSLILIARLFLENPVDTSAELADSQLFRNRLEILIKSLSLQNDRDELLYTISALSCCGTFKSAEVLSDHLTKAEAGTEERRLLLLAIERIHRRSYLCPEIDDLGKGRDWLREIIVKATRDAEATATDKNTLMHLRNWLEFERKFMKGDIAEQIRLSFASSDELNPASLLGAEFSEEEHKAHELTEFKQETPGTQTLAHWDFLNTICTHKGTAEPAKGISLSVFKDIEENTSRIVLNKFGHSRVILPFRITELPELGITIRIKQLSAARNYFAYQGVAQIAVVFDGKPIADNFTVTRHGLHGAGWDSFFIARHYLTRGAHEFEIQLSTESTTTHWLYEVSIEDVEVR